MAEREGIAQLPYYDDPEALALARKASEQMADHEFIEDKQYRLRPEAQFGGKYGMVPGIGYGGDYPQTGKMATIRSMGGLSADTDRRYMLANQYQDSDVSDDPAPSNVIVGEYIPKNRTPEQLKRDNLNPDFRPGVAPGSVHFYQNREMLPQIVSFIDTPKEADQVIASTLNHELLHRGADVLPLDALKKFAEQKSKETRRVYGTPTIKAHGHRLIKYDLAAYTFNNLRWPDTQHYYTDALHKFLDPGEEKEPLQREDKDRLRELEVADEVMREFFTPERQEQYQIRLPTRSAEPEEKGLGALFRRLFD